MLTTEGKTVFLPDMRATESSPGSRRTQVRRSFTSIVVVSLGSIPSEMQATVVVEVDQTIPTTWPSRVPPSHKSLIGVADGVGLCGSVVEIRTDTACRHACQKPRTSALSLRSGRQRFALWGKEEEVTGNDDSYLDPRILAPTDEDLCHGFPFKDACNFPIHGIEWCVG